MAYETMRYTELVEKIGLTSKGELLTETKLRPIRNKLEYRFLCYLYISGFVQDWKMVIGLNRYPKLNKRHFDVYKFREVPADKELIKKIALDKVERPVVTEKKTFDEYEVEIAVKKNFRRYVKAACAEYIFKSEYNLAGEHKSGYVSYINSSGYCYDHSMRLTTDLLADERKSA